MMFSYETAGITRLTCKRCKKAWWWKIVLGYPEPELCAPCGKQK